MITTDPAVVVTRYIYAVRDGDSGAIRDSFAEDAIWEYPRRPRPIRPVLTPTVPARSTSPLMSSLVTRDATVTRTNTALARAARTASVATMILRDHRNPFRRPQPS